jgi:hypothetical protein
MSAAYLGMIDHKLPKPPHTDAPSSAWLPAQRAGKRRMLWEIGGSMQCSVLGTCLSEDDLLGALRKCGLSLPPSATSYDIHAHCVKMATSANALSKALHKLLDKRYEGGVRLVSRAETAEQMLALWAKLRDTGQIGAAYWAVVSHTHVPTELARQVFGEVHMLSTCCRICMAAARARWPRRSPISSAAPPKSTPVCAVPSLRATKR